jgi:NADH:ubiquinone oxidoreductase subunit K
MKGFSLRGCKTKALLNTCNVYKRKVSPLVFSIKMEKNKKKYKYIKMNLALILFVIGSIGFVFNRNNLILMIISIEITLLSVTVMILSFSWLFNDIGGEVFGLYIIAVAGAESAIGLAIMISYMHLRKHSDVYVRKQSASKI